MKSLTIVERLVLESLSRSSKNILELQYDTELGQRALINIIRSLETRELLESHNGIYEISPLSKNKWSFTINNPTQVKDEVKEMLHATTDSLFKGKEKLSLVSTKDEVSSTFALKKVWMNNEEEKIFYSLVYNLESFLNNLAKDQKKSRKKTIEKKVIFWGVQEYDKVVSSLLTLI